MYYEYFIRNIIGDTEFLSKHRWWDGHVPLFRTPKYSRSILCVPCYNPNEPFSIPQKTFKVIQWTTNVVTQELAVDGTNFKKNFTNILLEDFTNPLRPIQKELDVFRMLYEFDWPFGERP